MDQSDTPQGGLAWAATDACTLPTAERPLRVADFDALFAAHLRRLERPDATRARLELAGGPELADRVRRLAEAESSCCSFFTFTVSEDSEVEGRVVLDVAVPPAYAEVLDGLAGRAASALDA